MFSFDINNLFGVKGMVLVITGGGSGLGLYVAKALDANGAEAVYISVGAKRHSKMPPNRASIATSSRYKATSHQKSP